MKHIHVGAVLFLMAGAVLLAGCAASHPEPGWSSAENGNSVKGTVQPAEDGQGSYRRISQEEAQKLMAQKSGQIVVDVRRREEFDEGHIPGAICVPNESIGCDAPEALPDYDQMILIYCRSGNRSKQAAQKLAGMGYTRVYEFGGINTWTGAQVSAGSPVYEGQPFATLSFDAADGGGREYVVLADPAFVFYESSKDYHQAAGEAPDSYTLTYQIWGLRPGITPLTVMERSPVTGEGERRYTVTVDETLQVMIEEQAT